MNYGIRFDFDCEGDPPSVFIAEDQRGSFVADIIEVLEEPTLKSESFSWEDEDWEPGPLAAKVLRVFNEG